MVVYHDKYHDTGTMIDQHHYRLLTDFGGYGNKLDLETCL